MSDVIKLLPDSVANQIAAGEVIQRPASVIKELVENAIDAQATDIHIVLKDAGRTLIQVIDNGVGMSDTDARLAFERHSTSKIRQADDLFALNTMGFRGEALASIAAISHIELRTCARGNQLGTKLIINASHCESQEPDVCPVGCNFMVKDIFFNVPARRKFLKSNQVELSNIIKEFEKLALVNYNVEFTLTHNGNVLYKLNRGSFKQRIVSIFGHSLDQQLMPLNVETSLVKISGFIGKPENARKRNALQFFFVNGRYMRHPYFHKAVNSCYNELIPDDAQPNYFLIFDVDPETIDVNIHPTKTEIKFENEMPIWQIVSAAVKETLGRFSVVPSIDFDKEDAPEIPALTLPHTTTPPAISVDKGYNPFNDKSSLNKAYGATRSHDYGSNSLPNWEELYKNFEKTKQEGFDEMADNLVDTEGTGETPILAVDEGPQSILQLDNRYLLFISKKGVIVIDQHRAHLAVLFNRLIQQIDGMNIVSQRVLFPEIVHFDAAQNVVFEEIETELEKAGFGVSKLSGGDWSINSVPPGLDNVDVKDLLNEVISSVSSGGGNLKDKVFENIALTIATRAAIPYGRQLNSEEMKSLVADWQSLNNNKYTPNGKLIVNVLSLEQVAKMF
ncbi:MAG: DNA mismatch repair endonuclease MutL [Muribaculaceae bacterium]|nr:DNA mismatch repair endonuclease MutL [Muribaculaceae bacterium]